MKSVGWVLLGMALAVSVLAAESPYWKDSPVAEHGEIDRLLRAGWAQQRLAVPREASDAVFVRRACLDLLGRLPTMAEAKEYVQATGGEKRAALIDRLLNDDGFPLYWTQHWCDLLRIKSEFPINLWPNAVYGYQRRIHDFLRRNEPYDDFVRALLTSSGSNFRVPEVNFYRAMANRTAAGIAGAVALSFMGLRYDAMSETDRLALADFFAGVRYKSTKEWKEEIVYVQRLPEVLPRRRLDGRLVEVAPGEDARAVFCDDLLATGNPYFSRALVNRVWHWFFGHGLIEPADDLAGGEVINQPLLDHLANDFARSGYDIRRLCRQVALSSAYCAASCQAGVVSQAEKHFASYPVRRLGAEVLDDAIGDLTGVRSSYSSVIPEPFTYIPARNRTVSLADGSISSSFLILFGRPARDSGELGERNNAISAKQRLFLFNSGELYRKLQNIGRREEMKSLDSEARVDGLYWLFLSRSPTAEEKKTIHTFYQRLPSGKARWRFQQDLCWVLVNSAEFLHQH